MCYREAQANTQEVSVSPFRMTYCYELAGQEALPISQVDPPPLIAHGQFQNELFLRVHNL